MLPPNMTIIKETNKVTNVDQKVARKLIINEKDKHQAINRNKEIKEKVQKNTETDKDEVEIKDKLTQQTLTKESMEEIQEKELEIIESTCPEEDKEKVKLKQDIEKQPEIKSNVTSDVNDNPTNLKEPQTKIQLSTDNTLPDRVVDTSDSTSNIEENNFNTLDNLQDVDNLNPLNLSASHELNISNHDRIDALSPEEEKLIDEMVDIDIHDLSCGQVESTETIVNEIASSIFQNSNHNTEGSSQNNQSVSQLDEFMHNTGVSLDFSDLKVGSSSNTYESKLDHPNPNHRPVADHSNSLNSNPNFSSSSLKSTYSCSNNVPTVIAMASLLSEELAKQNSLPHFQADYDHNILLQNGNNTHISHLSQNNVNNDTNTENNHVNPFSGLNLGQHELSNELSMSNPDSGNPESKVSSDIDKGDRCGREDPDDEPTEFLEDEEDMMKYGYGY